MLSRRNILATSAAAATVFNIGGRHAKAAPVDVKIDPYNQTAAQKELHKARFDTLDQESQMSFMKGFRRWAGPDFRGRDARRGYNAYLRSRDLPIGITDLGYEECYNIMLEDPSYAAKIRFAQAQMWDRAYRAFHGEADKYLALMEETDNAGPGSLELNPDMDLPDYTCHEIHAQPGGYVGDPFAGWVYHWALSQAFDKYLALMEETDNAGPGSLELNPDMDLPDYTCHEIHAQPGGYVGDPFAGWVYHWALSQAFDGWVYDQAHLATAQDCPKPADGEVRRILDTGCGTGLGAMAFKERFPDAEVWGIDVGGPMVRKGHYEAVQRNLDVNFAQRLAEDTKFPDGYFDIVSDYLVFHEVSNPGAAKIVPEIYRILRPGGIFNHDDSGTLGNPNIPLSLTIEAKAWAWVDHRHNVESWILGYRHTDFPGLMRKAGFDVDLTIRQDVYRRRAIFGVKPA